jgi:hypothetical protein
VLRDCVVGLGVAAALMLAIGCRPAVSDATETQVDLTLNPSPPRVGSADVLLKLADASGSPLEGASVRLEGNMNHAGMKPSFADLQEVEPGQYSGAIDFTMGGDWFILVTAKTPNGKTIERKIDVPGVKSE